MATAYYIMKMTKSRKKPSFYDYYKELAMPTTCSKIKDVPSKCRICLKVGTISIYDDETAGISEALQGLGDIKISENDGLPKLLCETCFLFTKAAIQFRSIAKRSDEILRQPVKEEHFDYSQDSNHDYEDSSIGFEPKVSDDWSNNEVESAGEIKQEQGKEKSSDKTPSDYNEHELTAAAHIHNVKNLAKVDCDICKLEINRSYYLRHLLNHSFGPSPTDNNRHICRICNKELFCEADIKIHMHSEMHKNAVKTASKIECPVCHATVKRVDLKTHLSIHNKVTNSDKLKCPICTKIMAYSYYTTHLKQKHNIDLANETIGTIPTLQDAAKKSEIAVINQEKSEEILSVKNEDSNKEMQYSGENCFNHEFKEDTAKSPEPPSCDKGYGLGNTNIPIEERRNVNSDDVDSNMYILVVTDMENEEKQINDNKQIVNPVHTCVICNLKFQTSDDYYKHIGSQEHMNIVNNCPKTECNICGKTINRSYYFGHLKYHCFKPIRTGSVYKCKICDETLLTSADAKIHMSSEKHKMSESVVSEIECPICHMIVETAFLTHLQQHVSELPCKQKCPICSKCISFKYYATHLKKSHNVDKPREVYMDKDIEYKGNTTSSSESNVKSFVCDICGKAFAKPFVFKAHRLIHGSEMKYRCEFCPYRTHNKACIKIHLKTHLGIYKFKCDICPELKFLSKSNLIRHIKTHRGPIDFTCEICHKGFYTKGDLKSHIEGVHLGMRNHVCNICNNTFAYKKGLRNHLHKIHNYPKMRSGRQANYLKKESLLH